jgi:hypothetical protein
VKVEHGMLEHLFLVDLTLVVDQAVKAALMELPRRKVLVLVEVAVVQALLVVMEVLVLSSLLIPLDK